MITLSIDTTAFNRCLADLGRFSGASQQQVIDAEFGKVIEAAVRFTPAASIAKLRNKSEMAFFSAQPEDLYAPMTRQGMISHQKARRTKNGKILFFLMNRYPDRLWAAMSERRKQSLEKKLAARGLAKQSWQRIAAALGITVKVPGFVAKAMPTSGQSHPENASGMRHTGQGGYGIEATNSYPLIDIPTVGGRRALQRAIDGRVKYFQKNLELGVFWDLKKICARYPGISLR